MNALEALASMHVRAIPRHRDHASPADWTDELARSPIFASVDRRRLRKLAASATTAELLPGETIVHAGDHGDALYVILGGEASAVSRRERRALRAGDYFGELALIDGRRRSATVVAVSHVHVIELPSGAVLKLARRDPALTRALLRHLAARLRGLEAGVARAA